MRKLKLPIVIVKNRRVVIERDFSEHVFMNEICALHLAQPIAQSGMRKIYGVKSPHHDGEERGVTTHALARKKRFGFRQVEFGLGFACKDSAVVRERESFVLGILLRGDETELSAIGGRRDWNHATVFQRELQTAPLDCVGEEARAPRREREQIAHGKQPQIFARGRIFQPPDADRPSRKYAKHEVRN